MMIGPEKRHRAKSTSATACALVALAVSAGCVAPTEEQIESTEAALNGVLSTSGNLTRLTFQDPSETSREQNLGSLDELVRRGRFPAELLHRLATVLDATDVNVPIPLWEAASRTPQPASGYLPETGVLAQLQEAAKKKEMARTVLLVMRALGPAGPDGAHIIALGDAIRALRRVGLESEARGLGVEALIAQWPRSSAP